MDNVERARRFVDSCEILDGHTDTENAKEIVRGLLAEIERLQPKVAKWITVRYVPQGIEFKRCTCCDYLCMGYDGETGVEYDYCPDCGARMENGNSSLKERKEMDKVIKAFEEYVNNFKPCCTSDDVDLEMLKGVLAIVKGEVKLQTKLELLKESFDDYEKHMGHYPKMVIVTENVLQTMTNEAMGLYAFVPSNVRPTFYGVPVRTVNDNEALFITRNGSAIKYSLDEWREIE